jgi:hypothetical protein
MSIPPPTFRDEDVKNLKGFLEFVRDKASFKVDLEECLMVNKYVAFMQGHIRKVNDHVMELVRVIETPPGDKVE